MAGSGQPWFMPLLWPVGHVFTMYKNDQKPFVNKATAELDLFGHFTSFAGALRAWMMALGLIYYLYHDYDYPGFGRGKTFSLDWILPILFRNVVCTWLICAFWDYILYFSPFSSKLDQFKFTKIYPCMKQFKHDSFWTTTASIFAALIEVVLCYLWSNNYIKCDRNIMDAPIKNIILAITVTHWRIPHFWLIHRMMHPWKTTNIPDFGKILYKHVHSLHHKSYNPTSFSGTSMHPIESTLYYSASLLCLPFAPHPSIALTCIVDCATGAWLGHDGFQWPGSGDYFHQLHHLHFDGNYGAMHVPIDKWLGTFISCRDDLKKIWKDKSKTAGKEANERVVGVHPSRKPK